LSSRTQIEVYECSNFSEPKARINANVETLAKKADAKKFAAKGIFWFDGFEFIPSGGQ
jgi:hypothetical protein